MLACLISMIGLIFIPVFATSGSLVQLLFYYLLAGTSPGWSLDVLQADGCNRVFSGNRYSMGYLADFDHHLRIGSLSHRSSWILDHLRVSINSRTSSSACID